MIHSKFVSSKLLLLINPSSILQGVKLITDSAMLVMFVYEFRKLKNLLHTYMEQGANSFKTGNLDN